MTTQISGFCEERFAPLKEAFRSNFDDGLELGASLALTHGGRMVVDLWAGWANLEETRRWENDTIVSVFSTTKIMIAISTLMLIDRVCSSSTRRWRSTGRNSSRAAREPSPCETRSPTRRACLVSTPS
jgi:hypothetical protein